MRLDVGTRIIGIGNQDGIDLRGLTGTIIVNNILTGGDIYSLRYGVQFDSSHANFHDCYTSQIQGKVSRCLWVDPKNLKALEQEEEMITPPNVTSKKLRPRRKRADLILLALEREDQC